MVSPVGSDVSDLFEMLRLRQLKGHKRHWIANEGVPGWKWMADRWKSRHGLFSDKKSEFPFNAVRFYTNTRDESNGMIPDSDLPSIKFWTDIIILLLFILIGVNGPSIQNYILVNALVFVKDFKMILGYQQVVNIPAGMNKLRLSSIIAQFLWFSPKHLRHLHPFPPIPQIWKQKWFKRGCRSARFLLFILHMIISLTPIGLFGKDRHSSKKCCFSFLRHTRPDECAFPIKPFISAGGLYSFLPSIIKKTGRQLWATKPR